MTLLTWQLYQGDALSVMKTLQDQSVNCVVTSPPYFNLRDYQTARWEGGDPNCDHVARKAEYAAGYTDRPTAGSQRGGAQPHDRWDVLYRGKCGTCGAVRVDQQIGMESSPQAYVAALVEVFREVRRVLRDDGVIWLNAGDSYSAQPGQRKATDAAGAKQLTNAGSIATPSCCVVGLKPKDLIGAPWMLAFALRDDGWWLRSDVIWCLSGGARVYARTQKGDMPMTVKDLVRLDPATVKLWNGEKWTQALGWSQSSEPRDGALEIELRSGERIGCTPGHVWPTQGGDITAADLVAGDLIRTTVLPDPESEVNASALDDDVAWFCGLYLAEGSLSGQAVQITGHANETDERLVRLEKVAAAFHGSVRVHTNGNVANININGRVLQSVIQTYVYGTDAKNKGIKVKAWQRGRSFLWSFLEGYLAGDGHYDAQNDHWRLGFTRNDRLAADLRTLAARLGLSIRLSACTVTGFGREWPAYRGDIRLTPTDHHNARDGGEVVAIRASRAREFWDIGVEDEPHLFALASGVLTHNSKKSCMPESVRDRPTRSHEYVFLLTKSARYWYDADAIREPYAMTSWTAEADAAGETDRGRMGMRSGQKGRAKAEGAADGSRYGETSMVNAYGNGGRNVRTVWGMEPEYLERPMEVYTGQATKDYEAARAQNPSDTKRRVLESMEKYEGANARTVWSLGPEPSQVEHFAVMPRMLARRCILAGCPQGGTVLDPFAGSGTSCVVALEEGRNAIGIELNEKYHAIARERLANVAPLLATEVPA